MLSRIMIVLIASALYAGSPLSQKDPVGFLGVGPIKMGMKLSDLKKVIGLPVTIGPDSATEGCGFVEPKKGLNGIGFMVIDGVIERTDVTVRGFRTIEGARVGDSEKQILQIYKGRVEVSNHTYVTRGHYLTIRSSDKKYALVFETDGQIVTSFRIGRVPAAEYIEGCA